VVERGLSPCVYIHRGQRERTGIFDGSERIWVSPGFMDRSIVWGGTEGTRTIDGTEKTGVLGSTERKGVLGGTEGKGVLLGSSMLFQLRYCYREGRSPACYRRSKVLTGTEHRNTRWYKEDRIVRTEVLSVKP
jgi:hypothetical protein